MATVTTEQMQQSLRWLENENLLAEHVHGRSEVREWYRANTNRPAAVVGPIEDSDVLKKLEAAKSIEIPGLSFSENDAGSNH